MNLLLNKVSNRIKLIIHNGIETMKYWLLFPFATLAYRNKQIFLVAERGVDARDNGYHFFKYLASQHPEVTSYYVIDANSSDYEKVSKIGNVVQYGSLKHYMLFIGASYKISTHIMGYSPDMLFYVSFNQRHRIPGKQIFLQHGIIKDDHEGLYAENTKIDLFVCGAAPEYAFVSERFRYVNNEVAYTGLARYDALQPNKTNRQILIMPTWRVSLRNIADKEFMESEYYHCWNNVLNDERLNHQLEKNNISLVFYPHYEFQRFLRSFNSTSSRVILASFNNFDVQELLIESDLLVTDYSSVFFDFAYMGKPCLYYQFDRANFYATHYRRGYFDYDTMGFGAVCISHNELIDGIIDAINDNFKTSDECKRRIEAFFPLHDERNCERIFSCIERLQ